MKTLTLLASLEHAVAAPVSTQVVGAIQSLNANDPRNPMSSRFLKLAAVVLVALAGTAYTFGGWAVITVESLPEYVTAGQPAEIGFYVRQHGLSLLSNLQPTIDATDSRSTVRASAVPAKGLGHYAATLVVPRAGDWTITIRSGFLQNRVTLAPVVAVAPGSLTPRQQPLPLRGEHLFIAKGCVTCHVHGAIAGSGPVRVGPDLTPRRYQAEYLARFLAEPSIARTPGVVEVMPKLELTTVEMTALTAFLNADRAVSTRQ